MSDLLDRILGKETEQDTQEQGKKQEAESTPETKPKPSTDYHDDFRKAFGEKKA